MLTCYIVTVHARHELIFIWHYLRLGETEYHNFLKEKTIKIVKKKKVVVSCHCLEVVALCHVCVKVEADLWLLHIKPFEQHNLLGGSDTITSQDQLQLNIKWP